MEVTVWDVPVRLFHWGLAVSFVLAYLSAKFHLGFLHVLIGYFVCALLFMRVFWGVVGNKYARFSSFVFSSGETLAYLHSMLKNNPKHYAGHNPAGALMVFALLGSVAFILLSGVATLAVIDFEGPLLFLANYLSDDTSYAVHHWHGWFVDFALLLIPLHLLGVIVGSVQHKENLARAMITGKKKISTGI
jgi:cytochrome b